QIRAEGELADASVLFERRRARREAKRQEVVGGDAEPENDDRGGAEARERRTQDESERDRTPADAGDRLLEALLLDQRSEARHSIVHFGVRPLMRATDR